MCYTVKCKKCGKTTWAGCGMHKNSVMEKVPESERCQCPRNNSFFSSYFHIIFIVLMILFGLKKYLL